MKVSRRTALKGGAGVGAGLFLSRYVPGWLSPDAESEARMTPLAQEGVEEWVPTTCWIGKQDCGMLARKIDGRVVKFEGLPGAPRNLGTLCPKGMGQIQAIYDPNRVKTPLVRTNEKGVAGEFREASWDEALTLVGDAIKEENDAGRTWIWQKGRSKAKGFYDEAFVHASGGLKLHHGAFCSDAGYRAMEYTTGLHGVMHPDFRYTKYLLSFGWDVTNGGGNKYCQLTWHQELIEAREKNALKLVQLDPSRRVAGPFADEWLPIRPGTDLAFFLALANVLVEEGFLDEPYLKKFTNAPFLVKADGYFLTKTRTETVEGEGGGEEEVEVEVPQVWDLASGGAIDHDADGVEPALDGSYTVDGVSVRTGFEVFKEHVADSTPEWAAEITGLRASQIRQVALDMGKNAFIGSTIIVDGVEVPYRPVAIMAYHVAQQELGFQALRAALMVEMLLGAVGAAGGQMTDFKWSIYKNYEPFGDIKISDPPYNIYLKSSKFFPINSNCSSIVAHAMLDPQKWEVEEVPQVNIIHMANPVIAFPDQKAIMDSYQKFRFVAAIDPWLSETADLYADVVLPAATIEKYEGPLSVGTQYTDAKALRLPPMDPLFDSRGDIDIYIDLCEKAGVLYGEGGYIDEINGELELEGEFALDLETKPDVRDIFDRWSKSEELEGGIEFFEKNGVWNKGPLSPEKRYGYAADPPFAGALHRFYGESLLDAQDRMKEMGVDEIFWRLYTALPTWMDPTLEGSPAEYDLYLISRKMIEFKQARSTFIPILNELAPRQFLEINPKTAKEKGIGDGDEVVIESQNAVTGETRKVKTHASYLETIRPDTVCLPHHFGFFSNPITKDQGPSANTLFFSGEGYVSNTADQSFHVKVKVEKA